MKYILLIITLFCALQSKAQNNNLLNYISIDKQFFIPDLYFGSLQYSKSCNSEEILFCSYNIRNDFDSINFYIFDMQTDTYFSNKYYIKGLNASLIANYTEKPHSISLSSKYIAILTYDFVYLLNRETKSIVHTFCADIKNKKFENLNFIDNDKLSIYCNYNFYKSTISKTQINTYSIPDFQLLKTINPHFDMIQYSHINPQHWIDFNNKKILFSNTVNYKISIFDDTLELIDSIYPQNYIWNTPSKTELLKLNKTNGALDIISEILKLDNHTDRIAGVYFISDSTIIVNINNGIQNNEIGKINYWFDVWKKKGNKWYLYKEKILDISLEDLKLENQEISLFNREFGNNLIFTENNIYLLTYLPPIDFHNISTADYIEKSYTYLYEQAPIFQIIKYKHKFNQ